MKHTLPLPETFSAISNLPLEVSYQQVEQWVARIPPGGAGLAFRSAFWRRWWIGGAGILAIVGVSLICGYYFARDREVPHQTLELLPELPPLNLPPEAPRQAAVVPQTRIPPPLNPVPSDAGIAGVDIRSFLPDPVPDLEKGGFEGFPGEAAPVDPVPLQEPFGRKFPFVEPMAHRDPEAWGLPEGWLTQGCCLAHYETGLTHRFSYEGHHAAYIRSKDSTAKGHVSLVHRIPAGVFAGEKVRLSARIMGYDLTQAAGLTLVAKNKRKTKVLARGRIDWPLPDATGDGWYAISMEWEVPNRAKYLEYGAFLEGGGYVFVDQVYLERVGDTPGQAPCACPGVQGTDFEILP